MTARQDINAALTSIRDVLGPNGLDIRVTQMFVVTRTWNGSRRGAQVGPKPYYVDSLLEVLPRPRIRAATLRDVDTSGGKIAIDDVIVDCIQPLNTAGGISLAQLAPSQTADGIEIFYKLVGEDNQGFTGDFYKKWLSGAKPFRHKMVLTRGATTPTNT